MNNIRTFTGVPDQRNTAFGIHTPEYQFPGFFAIVTPETGSGHTAASGDYTPYSWYEVLPALGGTWETFPTARTGELAEGNPAYELNNIETPAGSAVWLWYGSDVSEENTASGGGAQQQILDMRFAYGGEGGTGSGSGSGCTPVGYTLNCEENTITPDGGTRTLYPFDPGNLLLMPMNDGANISFGTTTGTIVGTAVNQKMAFWGAAPEVQDTGWSATNYTTGTKTLDGATATLADVIDFVGTLSEELLKGRLGLMGA